MMEWNKLSLEIPNYKSHVLLKIRRTILNSVFNVAEIHDMKLFTRLRIGWSHLKEHKFSHSFQDTVNTLCSCGLETKLTFHFFFCTFKIS